MKIAFLLIILAFLPVASSEQTPSRTIAVTIDDLPVISTRKDLKNRQEITRKLLGHVKKAKVPAIGFVNGNKLYKGEQRDEQQVDLLRMWLDAGLELGNHTFSHRSLNSIPLEEFQADILKGESITRELLGKKGRQIRYLRHPYLQTGRSLEVKAQLEAFLKQHGYTIAPVTVDNADYIFSAAYDKTFDKGDIVAMKKVGEMYVKYMDAKIDYWERQSMKLFGREIPQTLLIHANFINSDYFDNIALIFKKRGYKSIKLEEALMDEAYRLPDTFVGAAGISWLHRWALAKDKSLIVPDEPKTPEYVLKLSGFESE